MRNTDFGVMGIVIKFTLKDRWKVLTVFPKPLVMRIISIILLQMSSIIAHNPIDLNPADLIQCVGQSFNEQKALSVSDFSEPPITVEEDYGLRIISKTLRNPKQFTLFGVPVDQLHVGLDSSNKILAVYVRLKNQDLVNKMLKAIGDDCIAIGVTPENVEAPPSKYWWDYKGMCVSLLLYANRRMFITEKPPDDGLVTFLDCDSDIYDLSGPLAETNYVHGTNPTVEKQRAYFLKLAYSFYPKGMSDTDDLYGMTPQFKHLLDTLHEHEYLDEKWELLLSALKQRYECLEVGIPDPIMRGYRIAIKQTSPQPHNIVVNVSKLIPRFCFYTESDNPKNAGRPYPRYFRFNNFASVDDEVVSWVSEKIQVYFEGYKEFPPELVFSDVEDTEFDGEGVLLSNKLRSYSRAMTFFNAFFSSNIFYW